MGEIQLTRSGTHRQIKRQTPEHAMSIHSSLKTEGNLTTKRNVMKRAERVAALKDEKKHTDKSGALGLQKTKVRE